MISITLSVCFDNAVVFCDALYQWIVHFVTKLLCFVTDSIIISVGCACSVLIIMHKCISLFVKWVPGASHL